MTLDQRDRLQMHLRKIAHGSNDLVSIKALITKVAMLWESARLASRLPFSSTIKG